MDEYKIISNDDSVIIEHHKNSIKQGFEPFKKGEIRSHVSSGSVKLYHTEGKSIFGVSNIRVPLTSIIIDGATTSVEIEAKFADPTFLITEGASSGGGPIEAWDGTEIKIGTIINDAGNEVDYFQRGWVVQGNGTAMITLATPFPSDIERVYSAQLSQAQGSPFTFYYSIPNTVADALISAEDDTIAILWKDGSNPAAGDWRYYLQMRYTKKAA